MAIDTELAKRLRSYRNFKHLTQKDVAAHLNVPHSAISDIENGKRDITVSELKVFSNLYGRSVEEIMSGKKYDYYNIANIARLLTELPDDDLKEIMFIINRYNSIASTLRLPSIKHNTTRINKYFILIYFIMWDMCMSMKTNMNIRFVHVLN